VAVCLLTFSLAAAEIALRGADAVEPLDRDAAALRELLEGASGQREVWRVAPELVVLTSVMDYGTPADIKLEYSATSERLTPRELVQLTADLTQALGALTGGRLTTFSDVRLEAVPVGEQARVFRRAGLLDVATLEEATRMATPVRLGRGEARQLDLQIPER
jgi:hypothetical protein